MSASLPVRPIPPLRAGDRLSREEFDRRYHAMPHLKKAELIDGVVHMPSPVRQESHGGPHFDLITVLGHDRPFTPGVEGGDISTLRLDLDNEPQPDICLFIQPTCCGQVQLDADGSIVGGPEFVAEVAASSAGLDMGAKRRLFQRCGVREYLPWLTEEATLHGHRLHEGQYHEQMPDAEGRLRSVVFPGLWLNAAALLRRDLAAVLTTVQQGVASAEHAEFVTALRQHAGQ
jgi:hypothetical protein